MTRRTDLYAAFAFLVLLCPAAGFWAAGFLAAGCRAPAGSPPNAAGSAVALDPCADRLHDLCGRLLIYYALHKELPADLASMEKAGSGPAAAFVCPVSGKPYAYDPAGLPVPGWPGKLIMYDAEPCHSGKRWGILAEPLRAGQPLVVRVVQPPETVFRAPTPWPEDQAP